MRSFLQYAVVPARTYNDCDKIK